MMIKESKCVSLPPGFLRGEVGERTERTYLRNHEVFLRQQNEAGTCYDATDNKVANNITPFGKKKSFV